MRVHGISSNYFSTFLHLQLASVLLYLQIYPVGAAGDVPRGRKNLVDRVSESSTFFSLVSLK